MNTFRDTDQMLVERAGSQFKVQKQNMDKIKDSDLLLVERDGVQYKITGDLVEGNTGSMEEPVHVLTPINGAGINAGKPYKPLSTAITSIGEAGSVEYKTDTIASADVTGGWNSELSSPDNQWQTVTSGGGRYVAVCIGKTMYSDDAINWTVTASFSGPGTLDATRAVAYGNGKWVSVGADHAMYSDDGISWTGVNYPSDWRAVTYGDNKFVAVARTGNNRVMYSDDGITWSSAGVTGVRAEDWRSLAYGGGKFVAASYGTNHVMYSDDAITWTTAELLPVARSWKALTYGNGRFVAVAYGGNQALYSDDALTWNAVSIAAQNYNSVTYGNGRFVAVASGSTSPMYSDDGISWTAASAAAGQWQDITYGNGKFVAVSQSAGTKVIWSTTGSSVLAQLTFPTSNNFDKFEVGDVVQLGDIYSESPYFNNNGFEELIDPLAPKKIFNGTAASVDGVYSLPKGGTTPYENFELNFGNKFASASTVKIEYKTGGGGFGDFDTYGPLFLNGVNIEALLDQTSGDKSVEIDVSGVGLRTIEWRHWSASGSSNFSYLGSIYVDGTLLQDGIKESTKIIAIDAAGPTISCDGGTWTTSDTISKTVTSAATFVFSNSSELANMVGPLKMVDAIGAVKIPVTSTIASVASVSGWDQSQVWSNNITFTGLNGGMGTGFVTGAPGTNAFNGQVVGNGNAAQVAYANPSFESISLAEVLFTTFDSAKTVKINFYGMGYVERGPLYLKDATDRWIQITDYPNDDGGDTEYTATVNGFRGIRWGAGDGIANGGVYVNLQGVTVDGKMLVDSGISGNPVTDSGLTFNFPNPDLRYFEVGDVVRPGVTVVSTDLVANTMTLSTGDFVVGQTVTGEELISTAADVDYVNGSTLGVSNITGTWWPGLNAQGAEITAYEPSPESIIFTSMNGGTTAFTGTDASLTNRTWTLEQGNSSTGPWTEVGEYIDFAANDSQDGAAPWDNPTLEPNKFYRVKVQYNSNNADPVVSTFNTFKTGDA